jgi:hypothetical protein
MAGVSARALISLELLEFLSRDIASQRNVSGHCGSYYTYRAGRIVGEAAVFDSQGPVVVDRPAALQIATEKLEKSRKVVKIPGRDIASLRDNSPGLLLHDLRQTQYWTRRKPQRCCRLLLARRRWLLHPAESFCTQQLVHNGRQGYSKPEKCL